jgi:putative CocE/NonD family hydrolase
MAFLFCFATALLTVLPLPASAGTSPNFSKRYAAHDVDIAMRDGVTLHTVIVAPRDEKNSYPILLSRTPYGADSRKSPLDPLFAKAGYIFVFQDVRGRYKSGGTFLWMTPEHHPGGVDESTDTFDTIDWLVKNQPHNNGRVGLIGISYGGFFAAAGAIDAHPALKAVSPQAPQADWFAGDDLHHNGAFFLASYFNFAAICGEADVPMICAQHFNLNASDGYRFFLGLGPLPEFDRKIFHGRFPGWTETMAHGTYDSYWQARNVLPHLKDLRPAVLAVGGWYDANDMYGSLHVFSSVKHQSPDTPAALVMGPWYHAQWSPQHDDGQHIGALEFGAPTAVFFQEQIELPFFEHYLRDAPDPHLPAATVFDTGAKAWRQYAAWPPPNVVTTPLYFAAGKMLSFSPDSQVASDAYVSDPANPVPSTARATMDMDRDYMAEDQRFAAARPDVLVYESEPLASDMTVAGAVVPHLFVSTTGTDSDFVVKLIDVHPDSEDKAMAGFEELVRGDVARATFRDSLEKPEPLVPGQVTPISFAMQDAFHTFKAGHRIMVHIQSSWFPLVDRNPQSFVDIYNATSSDFHKATQQLHLGGTQASRLDLPVLAR